jgi:tRNA(Ile)-lysidine synthase
MSARLSGPVGAGELQGLFSALLPSCASAAEAAACEPSLLAVSGGCDSTALMVLFAEFLAARGLTPAAHGVVTVDHGLRPQSAQEAASVGRHALALGFRHHTLLWQGEKPATGLQAAARAARYRLIAAHARKAGLRVVMTGHTADDQAETLLMRLARGSGLDGLAAMAPSRALALSAALPARCCGALPACGSVGPRTAHALTLLRPLLCVDKARLRATLQARGIPWLEDPSNHCPDFERTRLRNAWGGLQALGLTGRALALSARRLQRARAALERAVFEFCDPCRGQVTADACGLIHIDAAALRRAPLEIAIRLLLHTVALAGGADRPVPLAKLEAVAAAIFARDRGAWTLARAKITATATALLIARERGRLPPPPLLLKPGDAALWDGRFLVAAAGDLGHAVEVCALGREGLSAAARLVAIPEAPQEALLLVPAFRGDGRLLAVPSLGYWEAGLSASLSAVFAPLCRCNARAWQDDWPDERAQRHRGVRRIGADRAQDRSENAQATGSDVGHQDWRRDWDWQWRED